MQECLPRQRAELASAAAASSDFADDECGERSALRRKGRPLHFGLLAERNEGFRPRIVQNAADLLSAEHMREQCHDDPGVGTADDRSDRLQAVPAMNGDHIARLQAVGS